MSPEEPNEIDEFLKKRARRIIDQCVDDIHSLQRIPEARCHEVLSVILGQSPDGYIETSPGSLFDEVVQIGSGVHLETIAIDIVKQHGRPGTKGTTDAERAEAFYSAIMDATDFYPYYCAFRMRSSSNKVAWLGMRGYHEGPDELVDGFMTPLGFENWLREEGLIFPMAPDDLPSGRTDELSAQELLMVLSTVSIPGLRPPPTRIQRLELNQHTDVSLHCPFCGQRVINAMARDENEAFLPCRHTLFIASDYGFVHRSDQFDSHLGLIDVADDEIEPPENGLDGLTDQIAINDSVKFVTYEMGYPVFGSYVGFAPNDD